jgi:hypothetical protein
MHVMRSPVLLLPQFLELLGISLNYPQKPLGLADRLALKLELPLVSRPPHRPSALELRALALATPEETDAFAVRLLKAP